MAQINITLDQEEILQLLCDDRDEAFRQLLQNSLNSVLKAESAEQLKAAPYERSEKRTDSRNGTRQRKLATRIGSITLEVPRHRNVPFRTMIFDNYSRSEAALIACMAEMVVNGVSTRKVAKVVETLCGETYTKSTVSELCKELDEKVEEFRNRPLEGHYPFIEVDATYFKVREKHRFISKAFMIAYGVNEYGIREILGFDVCHSETKETWNTFLKSLKKRGLSGLLMITSDAHEGIIDAVTKQYPGVPWQRCQFHFLRNIVDKTPKKYQAGLRTELHEMFNSKTMEAARKKRDSIISDYRDVAEAAVECLDEGFEDAMTVMILPHGMRRFLRTSNHIERLNKELKRRSKALGVFPNDRSVIRLMGAVLMERNDELQLQRAIFDNKTYASLIESEAPRKLIVVAEQQRRQAA
ncbi:MAG: IS256 family transposase [Solobacterium sp.]|nr:IS256 family transposase [Solobacterium sp.]